MSAFSPADFKEARERFKPLSRAKMTRRVALSGKTSPARGKSPKRAASAIPYGTNSLPGRKKKGKRKKLTDGQLKKRVWKEFSIFIRTRGADDNGFNRCVTCNGGPWHWKDLQAGHFLRGRLNANLFSELGVWPQCYACNVGRDGNVVVYYKFMLAEHGQQVIDDLIEQNNHTRKWQAGELDFLLAKYKALNAANPLITLE